MTQSPQLLALIAARKDYVTDFAMMPGPDWASAVSAASARLREAASAHGWTPGNQTPIEYAYAAELAFATSRVGELADMLEEAQSGYISQSQEDQDWHKSRDALVAAARALNGAGE